MDDLKIKDTILFVDDEQIVLNVGAAMIKKLGYGVLQATSGMEAAQIFNDKLDDICLVLLDINMPDENGSVTCKKIRCMFSDVKVIHTSGLGMNDANQTLDCGCKGFLAKPFRLDDLSKRIKECLEITDEENLSVSHFTK